ncbi:thioredoxin-like protein [Mrakia frigida]|uniref:thioredoxin family protein n=1 Tax=Mrakia frigida TaxID=29902 RepID=UPI003FCBFA8C
MAIVIANTPQEFDDAVSEAGSGLVVVDFHAQWCGPCHAIAPVFEKLANQHTSTTFIKVDTDVNKSIASRFRITAMPTFIFLRSSSEVERLRGADPSKLTSLIRTLAGPAPEGGWPKGKGNTLGGASATESTGGDGWLSAFNPLLVLSLIFFAGPWIYQKLNAA